MLGRLIAGTISWVLMACGLITVLGSPYSLSRVLLGTAMVLTGGFLSARLVYVAQRNDGRDTWHS